MILGGLLNANQPGRQEPLPLLVEQPVVRLQIVRGTVAERDDQAAAAAQVRFQSADLRGADLVTSQRKMQSYGARLPSLMSANWAGVITRGRNGIFSGSAAA